ncbi:hypothetical protein ACS0TY_033917 [Phlomoides rotata]
MELFREMITDLGLQDLGFTGHTFTWTNDRAGEANIQVRLDRALATAEWRILFPLHTVSHLSRTCSDHAPLLIHFEDNSNQWQHSGKKKRVFYFEKIWT